MNQYSNSSNNNYHDDDNYTFGDNYDDTNMMMSDIDMNSPQKKSNNNTIPLDHMDYGASLPTSSEGYRMNTTSTFFSTNHNQNNDNLDAFDDVDDYYITSNTNGNNYNDKNMMMDDPMSSNYNNKKKKRRRTWLCTIVILSLLGLIIGLSIAVPKNNKSNSNNSTTSSQDQQESQQRHFDEMTLRRYLFAKYNIDTHNDTSPHYIAAKFMSLYDLYNMKLPGYSNGTKKYDNIIYEYQFISRYIMILNYFSMGGYHYIMNEELSELMNEEETNRVHYYSTWLNELLFLSKNDICDWKGYTLNLYNRIENAGIICSPYYMNNDTDTQQQLVPTELSLIYNNLTGTIPTENGLLTSLTVFDMTYNKNVHGTIPTELCQLTNLRSLFVGYNSLIGTIPDCIGNLKHLRRLFLSNNHLDGTLPSSMSNLLYLERLVIDDNQIEDNPLLLLKNMKDLTTIILSNNLFTGILDDQFITDHNRLILFDISNNGFELSRGFNSTIPSSLFQLSNLEELDLSRNRLSGKLPNELSLNTKLLYFAIYNNIIHGTIPKSIMNLSSLISFDISNNHLTGIIPSEIQHLNNLTLLFLSDNPHLLREPIPSWLSITHNITVDKIHNTTTSSFTKLQELSIRNTNRTGTIPTELGTLHMLELLDMSENYISGTIPNTIRHLQQLQFILINNNTLINGTISHALNSTNTLRTIFMDGTSINDTLDNTLCQITNFLEFNNDGEVIYADCKGTLPPIICNCCQCCDNSFNDGCSKPTINNLDLQWETQYRRITNFFFNGTIYVDNDFTN